MLRPFTDDCFVPLAAITTMKKVSIMTMNSAMNLYLTAALFGLMNRFILKSGVIYRADVHHGLARSFCTGVN